MQISKTLLIVCAGTACAFAFAAMGTDNEAQAKAREALRQKLQESQPALVADSPVVALAREALQNKMQELDAQERAWSSGPSPDSDAIAKARAAVREQMAAAAPAPPAPSTQEAPKAAAAPAAPQKVAATAPAAPPEAKPAKAKSGSLDFPPLDGPGSPLSAEKQQQLNELLQKYRADQITPEQYHAERAKILAER
jgi:hypothetical protein